ncbi:DUF6444 domain-containing protein [Streptomyces kasugaensis]|uniref:DUF6444 domain-containing protein n=1 Tax=Streptomyces TaxID=1883 RepID=UPI003BF7BD85
MGSAPVDDRSPSYEELAALVVELRAELAAAWTRITDLDARLGQNSRNSSRPPSSDEPAEPGPKSPRGRSGRGPGRLKGQPGATLERAKVPDPEIPHRTQGLCAGCGTDLRDAPVPRMERRQVFALPEPAPWERTLAVSFKAGCSEAGRGAGSRSGRTAATMSRAAVSPATPRHRGLVRAAERPQSPRRRLGPCRAVLGV